GQEIVAVPERGLDEVRDDLGVGLRAEAMPVGEEPPLQDLVVLDDAVVNDDEITGAIGVRMRIRLGRPSMRGPARVRDPDAARYRLLGYELLQAANLAGVAADDQRAAVGHGQPRRVIAAILQPLKASQDELGSV